MKLKRELTWGVNGYGQKYYLCPYFEIEYGYVDPFLINHNCNYEKSENRGVKHSTEFKDNYNQLTSHL